VLVRVVQGGSDLTFEFIEVVAVGIGMHQALFGPSPDFLFRIEIRCISR